MMKYLQKLGKALMLPVAALPVCGILMGIGYALAPAVMGAEGPTSGAAYTVGFLLIKAGGALIDNMAWLFAIGAAVGLSDDHDGTAGLAGLVSFLMMQQLLSPGVVGAVRTLEEGTVDYIAFSKIAGNSFIGILAAVIGAACYNKFKNTQLPDWLAFFSGKRSVAIVTAVVSILVSVALLFVWPIIFGVLVALGNGIAKMSGIGAGIYAFLNRLLIPTGLHHLVYTPFLYTSLGGTATVGGQVLEGARNIYYAEIADPSVAVLSQSVIWDARGISKMFGLIGACLAMYQTARSENREKIKPVLITAAVTSFIAGVTEPIEFSFLFVAPVLFVVHAVLAGSSFVVLNLLGCRAIGPNGFIDFLLYNLPLGIGKTRWPIYIGVGVLYFFLYYVIFRVLIVKLNLHTLGREADGMEMKLHTKAEYKAKTAATAGNGTAAAPAQDTAVDAATIVEALGGKENILKVTNCYTRLRTELADPDKVQDDVLKNQTGASAVIHKGKNVQVVYGLKVNAVRKAVDAELGLSGED